MVLLVGKAGVEGCGDCFTVEIASDEYDLLHSVAIFLIPVAFKSRLAGHQYLQILFGGCGIPVSGLSEFFLHTGLLEKHRHITIVAEIYHTLGAYHILRPIQIHEAVEFVEIKRTTAEIYVCAYAVFLSFAPFMMVVMMVMMSVAAYFAWLVIVMMMVMLVLVVMVVFMVMVMLMSMLVVMVVFMVMVVLVLMILFIGIHVAFDLAYPCSGSGHLFEIEKPRIEQIAKRHIAIVAFNDSGTRLQRPDYLAETAALLIGHFRTLIEQDKIAEFYLFDKKVLDILLLKVFAGERIATLEFALHAESVYYGHDAIETRSHIRPRASLSHLTHGADSLGDWSRFADTARLDHYIIETPRLHDIVKLTDKVVLECAADATVLQSHQVAGIVLTHDAPFLYERCIDIHLAYIVYDYGETYSLAIIEDMIQKCGLAAAEISCKQQHRSLFKCHVLFL